MCSITSSIRLHVLKNACTTSTDPVFVQMLVAARCTHSCCALTLRHCCSLHQRRSCLRVLPRQSQAWKPGKQQSRLVTCQPMLTSPPSTPTEPKQATANPHKGQPAKQGQVTGQKRGRQGPVRARVDQFPRGLQADE